MKIRKLILHQVFIEWLPGTCSLLKESHEKQKKKWDSYFWGVGLLLFGWDSYFFIKGESRTPTFNIIVRTLTFFHHKLTTALLESAGENDRKIFHDQSPRKNVADIVVNVENVVNVAGVEPATSWSPVGEPPTEPPRPAI